MSRVGKKSITIPKGVTVALGPTAVKVAGPKGTLEVTIPPDLKVAQTDGQITVVRPSDSRKHRALHGTTRMLLANSITGVSEGFSVDLEIIGIGYQANMQGDLLVLQLGYSHDIYFNPPQGIAIEASRNSIKISGIDKQLVGQVAAKMRSYRKPEPYKGKGIRYKGEYVRHKQGKTVGGAK